MTKSRLLKYALLGIAAALIAHYLIKKEEKPKGHPRDYAEIAAEGIIHASTEYNSIMCALGEERFVNILQGTDTDMVTTFKSKYIDRLREYYYVGGMPEVVQTYVETKDFNQVREIQKNLLNYYQQDFSKHAETSLVPRLNLVWNSIPMQLAKKNKKYIYGQVRKGSRAKYFELAIQWLLDCGLIHKVQRAGKNFDYSVGSESGGKFEGKKPESVL